MHDLINFRLYLEFLEQFNSITYKGLPLVYFLNIYPFFNLMNHDNNLKYKQEFGNLFRDKLTEKEQFQTKFDQIIESIKIPQNMNKNGKIILYDELNLRFTDNVYLEYFDASTTVIVRTVSDNNSFLGIPIHILENKTDNKQLLEEIKTKADAIFLSKKEHPIFSIPAFQKRFYSGIANLIGLMKSIIDLFEKMSISCIVVGGAADHMSRMLILIGAAKGIPSICLQHGMIAANRGVLPVLATKECVYSIYEKEFFENWGVPDDRIHITGHPKYDRIFTENYMSKTDFCNFTGIPPHFKTALIATQPNLWDIDNIKEIIQYLNAYHIGVIIKPHPTEIRKGSYKDYETLNNDLVRVVTGLELYDVLNNVDVVCVEYSTTGLEAALFGKPVVYSSNKLSDGANYPYTKYLAQPNVKKLAYIIKELITNVEYKNKIQARQNMLISKAYPQKLAGNNLSDLIYKLSGIRSYPAINGLSEGMIIKGSGEKVYLIKDGMKQHISDPEVFHRLGLKWADVHVIDDAVINKIRSGIILK